jgi:hypothetical protein
LRAVQRVLRFLLVWLLAAAMPMKGMAAAVMLLCAPLPAKVVQAPPGLLAPGHAVHGGAEHHVQRHLHHPHQHHTDASPAQPPQPDMHGDTASADDPAGSSGHAHAVAKCGACAAMPAALPHLAPPPPGALCFEPMAAGAVRFLTGGPDRPPRSTIG